ncbi:MAG TPA: hypothetical protein VEG64_05655 [Candidatus Sulfotelmatobacter sp.]|nr:hypothetical protein [Candidatus Sulfotelmatobacter sp.]
MGFEKRVVRARVLSDVQDVGFVAVELVGDIRGFEQRPVLEVYHNGRLADAGQKFSTQKGSIA